MWKKEEDEEDEIQLMLDTFSTKSIKNSYSRISHFASCIKKYQGKNKFNMKQDELEELKSQILTFFKKEEITRQHILDFIKTFTIKSARGNENAFFFYHR